MKNEAVKGHKTKKHFIQSLREEEADEEIRTMNNDSGTI